ncbi:MAG: diguanylate cyclase domain-containing protein [Solirubrobacteraceae bacterium]
MSRHSPLGRLNLRALLQRAGAWPTAGPDEGRTRHAELAVLYGAGTALAGAVVFIVGWGGNLTVVRAPLPGPISMKAATAGMFVLCGTGVILLQGDQKRKRLGLVCAAACLLIALAFLSEYVVGWNLGIDEFPFRDVAAHAAHIAHPGRPGPTTVLCFVLVCVSLLRMRQRRRFEGALMLPVIGVAGLSVVGFAYSIPAFYTETSEAKIAFSTGIVFLILAVGVVFAGPGAAMQRMLNTTDPGGVMARRLLPLAIVVPLVLGWLQLVGGRDGLYGRPVGAWLLTTTTITCLIAVIVWGASALSHADRHRRRLEAELHRLAGEDDLTGLPNRRQFQENLRRDLALASRHHIPGALLLIDLDRFKTINDEHGHAAGDALLRAVSDALRQGLRDTDLRGRLGGDEFVAYLAHTDQPAARLVAEGVLALISTTSDALGPGMQTTASIGIATDYTAASELAAMLGAADSAMYRAKRDGGNRLVIWNPSAPHETTMSARDLRKLPQPIFTADDRPLAVAVQPQRAAAASLLLADQAGVSGERRAGLTWLRWPAPAFALLAAVILCKLGNARGS